MAHKSEEMRILQLPASVFEQAANEMGDVYMNRRSAGPRGLETVEADMPSASEYTLVP